MPTYSCNDGGIVILSDTPIAGANCTRLGETVPLDPETQPEVTFTPTTPNGTTAQGLNPQAPGGPGQSKAWSQQLLDYIFGADDEPTTPTGPRAPGCCPDGKPRCLACWLKSHGGWIVIAGLALAAYLLRKK